MSFWPTKQRIGHITCVLCSASLLVVVLGAVEACKPRAAVSTGQKPAVGMDTSAGAGGTGVSGGGAGTSTPTGGQSLHSDGQGNNLMLVPMPPLVPELGLAQGDPTSTDIFSTMATTGGVSLKIDCVKNIDASGTSTLLSGVVTSTDTHFATAGVAGNFDACSFPASVDSTKPYAIPSDLSISEKDGYIQIKIVTQIEKDIPGKAPSYVQNCINLSIEQYSNSCQMLSIKLNFSQEANASYILRSKVFQETWKPDTANTALWSTITDSAGKTSLAPLRYVQFQSETKPFTAQQILLNTMQINLNFEQQVVKATIASSSVQHAPLGNGYYVIRSKQAPIAISGTPIASQMCLASCMNAASGPDCSSSGTYYYATLYAERLDIPKTISCAGSKNDPKFSTIWHLSPVSSDNSQGAVFPYFVLSRATFNYLDSFDLNSGVTSAQLGQVVTQSSQQAIPQTLSQLTQQQQQDLLNGQNSQRWYFEYVSDHRVPNSDNTVTINSYYKIYKLYTSTLGGSSDKYYLRTNPNLAASATSTVLGSATATQTTNPDTDDYIWELIPVQP